MRQEAKDSTASLLCALPPVRRTRGWRLYSVDGRRFLDLYSEGGRTVLGRKASSLGRSAKAAIDTGLLSPLPGIWAGRLERVLKSRYPSYTEYRLFESEGSARHALDALRRQGAEAVMAEELWPFGSFRKAAESDMGISVPRRALLVLPLPSAFSCGIVLGSDSAALDGLNGFTPLLAGLPLALAVQSLADLEKAESENAADSWARIDRFSSRLFERSGPWLYPRYPREIHGRVFLACLESGILISPDYGEPSVVPGEFDEGEVAPLARLEFPPA